MKQCRTRSGSFCEVETGSEIVLVSYDEVGYFHENDMKIESGENVIAVLHTPREKLFGVLDDISAAGVALRAIDLSYFDDWCAAIANNEPHLSMSDSFIPMWRVEKISRDASDGEVPSLAEQFEKRTGRSIAEQ